MFNLLNFPHNLEDGFDDEQKTSIEDSGFLKGLMRRLFNGEKEKDDPSSLASPASRSPKMLENESINDHQDLNQ